MGYSKEYNRKKGDKGEEKRILIQESFQRRGFGSSKRFDAKVAEVIVVERGHSFETGARG